MIVSYKRHLDLIHVSILIHHQAKPLWREGVCVLLWTTEVLRYLESNGKIRDLESHMK